MPSGRSKSKKICAMFPWIGSVNRLLRGRLGGPPKFLINGKEFDHDRVDQTMKLGDVEEWTITSKSDEWHTFHIHVNDL